MIDSIPMSVNTMSFREFLLTEKRNRNTFWLVAMAITIQFIVFKYFYPYPSFIHYDSFMYLEAASKNLDINFYPIGYSRFLRLFSSFTSSDIAFVAFQYLLVQVGSLFFLFTLFYFYKPSKPVQIVLLCFLVLNPLYLYLANLISSDCFFLSISFVWFSLLLWIIHKPTVPIVLWHSVILLIAFTVRYNALIYPLISVIALALSKLSIRNKLLSVVTFVLLCCAFIIYTGNKYKTLTGQWQFSPFSGWQLANNAMYAYRYVDSKDREAVPPKLTALDNSIRTYFDSTRNVVKFPVELFQASTFYMWQRDLSLFKYRDQQFINDRASSEFKKWASMGPLYEEYGLYIIKKYPSYFMQYFLWPNTLKYYAPPNEYLEKYNDGKESIQTIAQEWFGYKAPKVTARTKTFKISILNFYPILSGIMNGVFICGLILFIVWKGFQSQTFFTKGVFLTSILWLLNAVFSIFSTSAALRFLAFPIILMCTFTLLLIDWISSTAITSEIEKNRQTTISKKPSIPAEAL